MAGMMFLVSLGLSVLASSPAVALIFFDSEFNDRDWSLAVSTTGAGGTIGAMQVAMGGHSGAFRQIRADLNAVDPGSFDRSTVLGVHLRLGATYDPGVQGAIASLDYADDTIVLDTSPGFSDRILATGPVLVQNGNLFFPRALAFVFPHAGWNHRHFDGLTGDFFVGPVDPIFHFATPPNFSATGAPIQFGFFHSEANDDLSSLTSAQFLVGGIDNWSVTVHTVRSLPVPASVLLVAAGAAAFFGILPRRDRQRR